MENNEPNINETLAIMERECTEAKKDLKNGWIILCLFTVCSVIFYIFFQNEIWIKWAMGIIVLLFIYIAATRIILPMLILKKMDTVRALYKDEDFYKNINN